MSYVVNNHVNDFYVLSNKAVGPGKKSEINKRLFRRLEYRFSKTPLTVQIAHLYCKYYEINLCKPYFGC